MQPWTITFNLLHFQKQIYTFATPRFPRQTFASKKSCLLYTVLFFYHPITHLMVMEMA